MRDFVKEIRNNTSKNKIIISQNGNELYFKDNKIDEDFFKITNGTTQESLYYGDVLKFNVATSKEANNELLKLLLPIRKKGKPIFVINYGKGEKKTNNPIKKWAATITPTNMPTIPQTTVMMANWRTTL